MDEAILVSEPARKRRDEARHAAERRQKETASLATIRNMEAQGGTLAKNGELDRAVQQFDATLDFIQSNRTENAEFADAIERAAKAKQSAQNELATREKRTADESRIVEQKRVDDENEKKGMVKVDGQWVTKEQAELARLRVEVEAVKNKPGKVMMTVTWKYNDFVGNKPDTGSVVVLVPEQLSGKLPNCLLPFGGELLLEYTREKIAEKGAYIEVVGGDGKAAFNRVKPGNYTLVVVSSNAKENPEIDKLEMKVLERFFQEPNTLFRKVSTAKIEVVPGETFEKSHDFGLTYF